LFFIIFIPAQKIRGFADTVGFAHTAWQMDSVMKRIERFQGKLITDTTMKEAWKTVIAPHDDYTYTGYLYPRALKDIKSNTVILIGVAHVAKRFKLEDKMIFDSFDYWKGPYGKIKVSPLRKEIISKLPKDAYLVHDSCQSAEHSLEAEIPFLQYYNKKIEIVPILIPYMNFSTMEKLAQLLASSIESVMKQHGLQWGKDFAIVISNDAVHYGDEEWGGRNFARFGCDSAGYDQAMTFEKDFISKCILGELKPERVSIFSKITLRANDYKEYKWTWCGRYSVPFGMLTTYYLGGSKKLNGYFLGYSTSLQNNHIPVSDLHMGVTAVCTMHHWVGYLAAGFK
jgi:AmmeMemoRadiSam system protein B